MNTLTKTRKEVILIAILAFCIYYPVTLYLMELVTISMTRKPIQTSTPPASFPIVLISHDRKGNDLPQFIWYSSLSKYGKNNRDYTFTLPDNSINQIQKMLKESRNNDFKGDVALLNTQNNNQFIRVTAAKGNGKSYNIGWYLVKGKDLIPQYQFSINLIGILAYWKAIFFIINLTSISEVAILIIQKYNL